MLGQGDQRRLPQFRDWQPICRASAIGLLGDHLRRAPGAGDLGNPLEDGGQVADRDALGEQRLQYTQDARYRDLARDDVLDELLLVLAQSGEQRLHIGVTQQVCHVGLEDLRQIFERRRGSMIEYP